MLQRNRIDYIGFTTLDNCWWDSLGCRKGSWNHAKNILCYEQIQWLDKSLENVRPVCKGYRYWSGSSHTKAAQLKSKRADLLFDSIRAMWARNRFVAPKIDRLHEPISIRHYQRYFLLEYTHHLPKFKKNISKIVFFLQHFVYWNLPANLSQA